VVVGDLRYAALFSHYSAQHPPVCEVEDEIMLGLYRDTIRRRGALLISTWEDDFDLFFRRIGRPRPKFIKYCEDYHAPLGGSIRHQRFVVGYLAPEKER